MKFKSLDGRETTMNILPSEYPVRSKADSKSIGQYNLGQVIAKTYPGALILEEFGVPGERLFLDFFMPHLKLVFEFHGGQHDEFNKFFHGTKKGFEQSKSRDARKKQWCELNNITLVEVRQDLTVDELRDAVMEARNG